MSLPTPRGQGPGAGRPTTITQGRLWQLGFCYYVTPIAVFLLANGAPGQARRLHVCMTQGINDKTLNDTLSIWPISSFNMRQYLNHTMLTYYIGFLKQIYMTQCKIEAVSKMTLLIWYALVIQRLGHLDAVLYKNLVIDIVAVSHRDGVILELCHLVV